MSAQETGAMGDSAQAAAAGAGQPTEDELRAAYEAELSRITTTDMIAQATVSLLNLGARRLGPPQPPADGAADAQGGGERDAAAAGRDLAQARDAIDAARALLAILERTIPTKELGPLRDALSQLQMAYAREIQTSPAEAPPPPAASAAAPARGKPAEPTAKPDGQTPTGAPGPAQASGRLWVPGS